MDLLARSEVAAALQSTPRVRHSSPGWVVGEVQPVHQPPCPQAILSAEALHRPGRPKTPAPFGNASRDEPALPFPKPAARALTRSDSLQRQAFLLSSVGQTVVGIRWRAART